MLPPLTIPFHLEYSSHIVSFAHCTKVLTLVLVPRHVCLCVCLSFCVSVKIEAPIEQGKALEQQQQIAGVVPAVR